ncbi:hypothetical protein [Spirosoma endbachense]|uniref:Uncharacterized protein n=1 Tax=Spirosoma endbachense TaxID=2666025 RepID=A0A6P1VZX4_9BACT|nr:hypothetical protein [Spirosoma endbachense]QHV97868.1 hypothetical protein GJR95_23940 [Spirosoma endbachense]
MTTTITTEQIWLDQICASQLVGICLLDQQGHLVQRLDDDELLRAIVIEYQEQRVRELVLAERTLDNSSAPTPS